MPRPVSKREEPAAVEEPAKQLTETDLQIREPWIFRVSSIEWDSGKTEKISCPHYGSLCILFDRFSEAKGKYTLYYTLLTTPCIVVDDLESAMQIGEVLWGVAPSAFRKETKEELLEALPDWIAPWMKRCKAAGKFVEVEA